MANDTVAAARLRIGGAFALQDGIVLAYQGVMLGLAWARGAPGVGALASLMAAFTLGCLLGRASGLSPRVRGTVYRLVMIGVLVANYFMLRDLLPAIRPDSVDHALVKIDVALFGVEPALWLARFNRPLLVEWFTFFYLSYFALILYYTVLMLWVVRPGRHTAEFSIGSVIIFCAAQLCYVAVPAYGPHSALVQEFSAPVHGGLLWGWVERVVTSYSAGKDSFPSLHAAVSIWFTMFAFRQSRRAPRYRWPARITGFAAANILVATVFLRWHYAIDVIAGVALALIAGSLSVWLSRVEEERRARSGLPCAWCFGPEGRPAG